jgi:hypothetical protein
MNVSAQGEREREKERERENLSFPYFFVLCKPSMDLILPTHLDEDRSLLSLLTKMLISPRNSLIDIPRNSILLAALLSLNPVK